MGIQYIIVQWSIEFQFFNEMGLNKMKPTFSILNHSFELKSEIEGAFDDLFVVC